MSIFSGIFKARDKPANSIAGSRYSFFFGGTSSGKPVNETTAMQMVESHINLIADILFLI